MCTKMQGSINLTKKIQIITSYTYVWLQLFSQNIIQISECSLIYMCVSLKDHKTHSY